MNITQTLLSNPSFVLDVQDGNYTANELLSKHCADWVVKPSVRRVREVVAIAKEVGPSRRAIHEQHVNDMIERIDRYDANEGRGYVPVEQNNYLHTDATVKVPESTYIYNNGAPVTWVPYADTKYGIDPELRIIFDEAGRSAPKFSIPESTQPVADDFLKLSGDFAIISDLHVPYHSSKTIEKFLDTAYSKNIRRFIINGDMNDCGQFHPKRAQFQHHSHRYQEDLELDKLIFAEFMKCFPEGGYVLSGNHGGWFAQNMKGELDEDWTYSKFFHEFPLIKFSNFEQCSVTSNNKTIRVAHGANYSGSNPLAVAQKLSAKFDEGICIGHQHLACSGYSWSGKHQVVCLGGSYDLSRLSYVHHSPRTNPSQTNGFALLQEGRLYPYDFQDDMR